MAPRRFLRTVRLCFAPVACIYRASGRLYDRLADAVVAAWAYWRRYSTDTPYDWVFEVSRRRLRRECEASWKLPAAVTDGRQPVSGEEAEA